MCIITKPKGENICNDIREATVATHQSGKGYEVISKITVRKLIITNGNHSGQLLMFPLMDTPAGSTRDQTVWNNVLQTDLRGEA